MKVSTLICVHSQSDKYDILLDRALDSIENQTRTPDEVVIVLDECWADTHHIAEQFRADERCRHDFDVVLVVRHEKEGLAAAKNYGLKYCTGEWITYLDADDEWEPTKLEKQCAFIETHPDYDFVGTLAIDVYDDGHIEPSCFQPGQFQTHEQIKARIAEENVMCHGSMMIRSSALQALGYYSTSPGVLGKEDWDLWRRALLANNMKFYNLPERLYRYSMETSIER